MSIETAEAWIKFLAVLCLCGFLSSVGILMTLLINWLEELTLKHVQKTANKYLVKRKEK